MTVMDHPTDRAREPLDYGGALELAHRAAKSQKDGEQAVRDASAALAEAERQYRLKLAQTIIEVIAGGKAATVAQDLARGDRAVADLRYTRDVAQGVLEAAQQRAWRHTADRKDVLEFIQWSRAREMAEGREG